jgi:opacity protein-like surface antigen
MKFHSGLMASAATALAFLATSVSAQVECVEATSGEMLCGKDAEAAKQSIRTAALAGEEARPASQAAPSSKSHRGSVYSAYSRRAFVRGGTAFAGGGSDFGENFAIAGGVGFDLRHPGLSVETEVIGLRDTETLIDPFLGTLTAKSLALAGLVSLRYDAKTDFGVNPFASVGVGPGYVRLTLDDGVTSISDDDITFAYSGRAGVTVDFTQRLGLEAAYRYLDTSQSGFAGQHLVELGLSLGF